MGVSHAPLAMPHGVPAVRGAAHDAGDDNDHYCPLAQLARFALLMAGHGRCVNTDMMLGDRDYALRQLASARALRDPELAQVLEALARYFAERA